MTRRRQAATGGGAARGGFTLVEMLVVLVLVSLLGTLVIQGTGFFLGQYARVKRSHRESSLATLQQHWFGSTVAAMVPSRLAARRFAGDDHSFEGVTLQPLAAKAGRPVRVRWSIDAGSVLYTERGAQPWTVLSGHDRTLGFQYADSSPRVARGVASERESGVHPPHGPAAVIRRPGPVARAFRPVSRAGSELPGGILMAGGGNAKGFVLVTTLWALAALALLAAYINHVVTADVEFAIEDKRIFQAELERRNTEAHGDLSPRHRPHEPSRADPRRDTALLRSAGGAGPHRRSRHAGNCR